jgi:co-chaperonin GroES (HSP10)
MSVTYEPLSNVVVVKIDEDIKQVGSIIIPDTASHGATQRGTVLSAGPGYQGNAVFVPTVVKTNDRVMFMRNSGNYLDKTDRIVAMRESDVLCKLHNE